MDERARLERRVAELERKVATLKGQLAAATAERDDAVLRANASAEEAKHANDRLAAMEASRTAPASPPAPAAPVPAPMPATGSGAGAAAAGAAEAAPARARYPLGGQWDEVRWPDNLLNTNKFGALNYVGKAYIVSYHAWEGQRFPHGDLPPQIMISEYGTPPPSGAETRRKKDFRAVANTLAEQSAQLSPYFDPRLDVNIMRDIYIGDGNETLRLVGARQVGGIAIEGWADNRDDIVFVPRKSRLSGAIENMSGRRAFTIHDIVTSGADNAYAIASALWYPLRAYFKICGNTGIRAATDVDYANMEAAARIAAGTGVPEANPTCPSVTLNLESLLVLDRYGYVDGESFHYGDTVGGRVPINVLTTSRYASLYRAIARLYGSKRASALLPSKIDRINGIMIIYAWILAMGLQDVTVIRNFGDSAKWPPEKIKYMEALAVERMHPRIAGAPFGPPLPPAPGQINPIEEAFGVQTLLGGDAGAGAGAGGAGTAGDDIEGWERRQAISAQTAALHDMFGEK